MGKILEFSIVLGMGKTLHVQNCWDFHSVRAWDKHCMYKIVGISLVLVMGQTLHVQNCWDFHSVGHGTNIACTKLLGFP